MLTEGPPDPTFVLSHAVAAAVVRDAVVRDADDRLAMLRAAAAIAKGNERAASRFGYCMASAIVDELRKRGVTINLNPIPNPPPTTGK